MSAVRTYAAMAVSRIGKCACYRTCANVQHGIDKYGVQWVGVRGWWCAYSFRAQAQSRVVAKVHGCRPCGGNGMWTFLYVDAKDGHGDQHDILFVKAYPLELARTLDCMCILSALVLVEKYLDRSALADCLWLGGTNVEAGASGLSYHRDGRRGSVPC